MKSIKSPLNGEELATLELTSESQLKEIMAKSRKIQKIWAGISLKERIHFMHSLRKYLVEEGEMLSRRLAKITGKPVFEAYASEIMPTIDLLHYYEKNAMQVLADKKIASSVYMPLKKNYIRRRPLGIVLVISPWNYPFQLSMNPIMGALISGNAVVLKPAAETMLVGKMIEEIFEVVNFPKDLVQVVYAQKDSGFGAKLIEERPDKIFFTGSTKTGHAVLRQAAEHMIPVDLELGGKDAMIVFKDANLERAAAAAVWGAFTNSGQVCLSVERLYVEESVYEKFISLLKAKIGEIWQGTEPYADLGCMVSKEQTEIVKEHLQEAKEKGAEVYAKGEMPEDSLFIPPMLLMKVNHEMKVMREETFGPLLPVMIFQTEEEAVTLANDSIYGLGASIFTEDLDKGERVAAKIEAGNIHINDVMVSVANPKLPFGGLKGSGMGRTHAKEGLLGFTQSVSVVVDTGIKMKEVHWFPYSKNKMLLVQKMVKWFKK